MIVGVSGYGATGASAVVALIMECKDIQSYKYGMEFQLLQEPDGILDLHHYIVEDQRRLSSHIIIKRFMNNMDNFGGRLLRKETDTFFYTLCEDYLKSLNSIEWKGKSDFDTPDVRSFLYKKKYHSFTKIITKIGRIVKSDFTWPPCYNRYYASMTEEQFAKATNIFLTRLLKSSGFNMNCTILLEQLFPPNEPTAGMQFFEDCRCIVVERDPRDLFIITNHLMSHKAVFMPNNGNVDDFIKYYKGLHAKTSKDSRVKYIQYEDLIYDYDNSARDLLGWLGLTMEKERTIFIPEESVNNTCLYYNYPELKEDIEKIEYELKEYLYPFEIKEKGKEFKRDIRKAFVKKSGDTKTRIKKLNR